MNFQLPKGTFDILPYHPKEPWQHIDLWHLLESTLGSIAKEYGFLEIRTPIYEQTALFDRSVGETSDIVAKEMFTFLDKGGRSLSLRPEGTASVARAFLEQGLMQTASSHKFYYMGPMFRYERPQSGRYRQFHQFGVEAIGIEDPTQDVEMIDLLYQTFSRLGLKNLKVKLNTVGDLASRRSYREALINYFRPQQEKLSQESKVRLEKNPLRILDSKSPEDKILVEKAPSILSHLSTEAKDHFQQVCRLLDHIQIPYEIDDRIVRGLDYYVKTVFEVESSHLGAQNTLGGGGRYDGLLASLGGANLPGIGFAIGLERILQTMIAEQIPQPKKQGPTVYFIPLGEEAKPKCFALATLCRRNFISAEVELSTKKIQTALQNANRKGAIYSAVIGSEELASEKLSLKQLETRQSKEIPFDRLIHYLQGMFP